MFIVYSHFFAASFFRASFVVDFGQLAKELYSRTLQEFRALCDQADNIALPRLWDSDVSTVPASSNFETRHGMNVHRRKKSSAGTGCADPSNSKSVSFTGRASISSSIVREHAFLGA